MDDIREKIFCEVITYDNSVGVTFRTRASGRPAISQNDLMQECYRLYKLTDEMNIHLKSLEEKNDQENVISGLQRETVNLGESLEFADESNQSLLDKIKQLEEDIEARKANEDIYIREIKEHDSKIANLEYKLMKKDQVIEGLNDAIKKGFEYMIKEKYNEKS